jgi:hypothetical protein
MGNLCNAAAFVINSHSGRHNDYHRDFAEPIALINSLRLNLRFTISESITNESPSNYSDSHLLDHRSNLTTIQLADYSKGIS